MSNKQPTPFQIRAAMSGLRWEYKDLSRACGLTMDSLSRICLEKHEATERSRLKIRTAFEAHGIEFLDNDGIRRRPQDIETFSGPDGFDRFMGFMYDYLDAHGGEVCISVTDERFLQNAKGDIGAHRSRMAGLAKKGVTGRILASDSAKTTGWAEWRQQPRIPNAPQVSFIAFGNNLALISFDRQPSPYVVLHKASPFAAAYVVAFDAAWERAEASE